jgi:hypothetical protein
MHRFLSLLPLVCCSAVLAAEFKIDVAKYTSRTRQERPIALARASVELENARKSRRMSVAEKRTETQRLGKIVSDLENPLLPYYGSAHQSLERFPPGRICLFEDYEADVHQIVDEKNATLVAKWWSPPSSAGRVETAEQVFRRIQSAAAS